jgi:hypothetical protein
MQDIQIQLKNALEKIDQNQFNFSDCVIGGDDCVLCVPNTMGVNWTQETKILRSVVYRKSDFYPVSLSFPKFCNWGEKPEVFPVPSSLDNCTVVEKLDGSLLIVSKYKGQYILRTRGTIDAHNLTNGFELNQFEIDVLPKIPGQLRDTWDYSVLFEWLSPTNKIVLNYGDTPEFRLVGVINHEDYSLKTQDLLDGWGFVRPQTYTFSSVQDLLLSVDKWEGKEGVCVYSKDGQEIHKVKAAKYLLLHYMKSEMSSLEKVLDVWLAQGRPSYNDFYNYIASTFDFEIAETARGFISQICDGWKEVEKIEAGMQKFLNEQIRNLPTRKLQAVVIQQSYGNTNRASYLFTLLDGKPLEDKAYKKLLFQVLKK